MVGVHSVWSGALCPVLWYDVVSVSKDIDCDTCINKVSVSACSVYGIQDLSVSPVVYEL